MITELCKQDRFSMTGVEFDVFSDKLITNDIIEKSKKVSGYVDSEEERERNAAQEMDHIGKKSTGK
ncbi:hypothetical protein Scep_027650 [Stephania cephalantha]|uniref:Uncharacterized protein n=1 Tax=Stephania cephalantha TaxID=152367 RepID=A0AAP0EFT9_9MAGN